MRPKEGASAKEADNKPTLRTFPTNILLTFPIARIQSNDVQFRLKSIPIQFQFRPGFFNSVPIQFLPSSNSMGTEKCQNPIPIPIPELELHIIDSK